MNWWFWENGPRTGLGQALERGRWVPGGRLDRLPFVVFDTETTGFHPHAGDEIIAIAARRLDNGVEFDALVNPGRAIPRQVTELTGITDAMVAEAPDLAPVLEEFFCMVGPSVLVAHCAEFDRAFLEVHLRKRGRLRWVHPVLDTQALAAALYPRWGDYRLERCADYLGVPAEGRHTALGDVRITAGVFKALLAECERRNTVTWEQINHLLHVHTIW